MFSEEKKIKINTNDLYAFDISSRFSLRPFALNLQLETAHEESNKDSSKVQTDENNFAKPTCQYCGIIPTDNTDPDYVRHHYKRDYHRYNIRRKLHYQNPLTEDEFETLIGELDESISGSDSEKESLESSDNEDIDKVNVLIRKTGLLNTIVEDEEAVNKGTNKKNNNENIPFFLYQSPQFPEGKVVAFYKSLFDKKIVSPSSDDIESLSDEARMIKALDSLDNNGTSAIFMIGGGHFAGAIISHKRSNQKPTPSSPYADIQILAQKSFHRYTTRRKQGGSQSANDNSKGKANSAGSTLRRYNEAALEKEIRELLQEWGNSYLKNVSAIYIRANGRSSRQILMNYANSPITSNDPRIKSLPFTTKRATANELKRSWWELTHGKLIDKPKAIIEDKKQVELKKISISSNPNAKKNDFPENPMEKHSLELSTLIKKSKVPSLIAYLRKHKLSASDFRLVPSDSLEFIHTPTLLHYASLKGTPTMITTLLKTLKADPTVKNSQGKTPYQISSDKSIQEAFQICRFTMGETVGWDWDNDAHVGPPLSKEEAKLRELEEKRLESEHNRNTLLEVQRQEMEKQKKSTKEKRSNGGHLGTIGVSSLSSTEALLSQLSTEDRRKYEREQRARAIEMRLNKK